METRRLELLVELQRLGSMREVADAMEITTSTVSQQIAALGRDVGAALVEPDGRRVRLTPAGRRLADHAASILASVEAARHDLDPDAEPVGVVRVAGFASAFRRSLLPLLADLAPYPRVQVLVREHEPGEALERLAHDEVDLALTYEYNLAPATIDLPVTSRPLWSTPWCLAVPTGGHQAQGSSAQGSSAQGSSSLETFRAWRDAAWIVNSRSTADEQVVRTLASMAGFEPRLSHRADSLELVEELVAAGLGVGLLPAATAAPPGVALLPLVDPAVELRAYAVTRRGRARWAPLSLVLSLLDRSGAGKP